MDMIKDKSSAEFENWGKKEWVKLAVTNPVRFMLQRHSDCFQKVDGYVLGLSEDVNGMVGNEAFIRHVRDAVEWRSIKYFAER